MVNLEKAMKASEAETSKKFENLEKALKTSDETLKNFRAEIFASFSKILDRVEENMKAFEEKALAKIEKIDANVRSSHDKAFKLIGEKIKNLENHVIQFQEAVEANHKSVFLTCDP